jgi:hypothetical protein
MKLLSLVRKDLQIHHAGILGGWLTVLLVHSLLGLVKSYSGVEQELLLLVLMNVYLNFLYSDWLIYREKTKRTFAFLRSLPISDSLLVTSKFIVYLGLLIIGFLLTSAILVPESFSRTQMSILLMYLAVLLGFGSTHLVCKWLMGPRTGQFVPFLWAFILLVLLSYLSSAFPMAWNLLEKVWLTAGCLSLLSVFCVVWIALAWWVTVRVVSSRDTKALLD